MTGSSNGSENLRLEGIKRALVEKKLLSLLFNGFANLTFKNCEFETISMLNEICNLNEYTVLPSEEDDPGYAALTDNGELCFNALTALDALATRGLVGRKIFFSHDNNPEDGPIDMDGRLDTTPAYARSWLARALSVSGTQERSFQYPEQEQAHEPFRCEFECIQYQLSTKGYDVALTFQEHDDQEKRNSQQRSISESAAQASVSSARTASIALYAAIFIAFGSVGHLLLSVFLEYSKHIQTLP